MDCRIAVHRLLFFISNGKKHQEWQEIYERQKKAKEISKELGAEYLRLFVVDINMPAIQLYRKKGFSQARGVFDEIIDEDLVLHEYGFEISL